MQSLVRQIILQMNKWKKVEILMQMLDKTALTFQKWMLPKVQQVLYCDYWQNIKIISIKSRMKLFW